MQRKFHVFILKFVFGDPTYPPDRCRCFSPPCCCCQSPSHPKIDPLDIACVTFLHHAGNSGRHWIGGEKRGKGLLGPQNNFWRDMFFLHNWQWWDKCFSRGAHLYIRRLINSVPPPETVWDSLRNIDTLWDTLRQLETTWDTLRQIETTWDTLRHSGEELANILKQSDNTVGFTIFPYIVALVHQTPYVELYQYHRRTLWRPSSISLIYV